MTKFFARWPSGREVVFRSLTWAEFQTFERALRHHRDRPMGVFCDIYRAVVLEGPPVADATAGVVEYVGQTLTAHNPFGGQYTDIKRAVDLKRTELQQDYLLAAKAVIASLFQISLAEINGWDAEQFFEYVAMAEFVSGRKLEPGAPEGPVAQKLPAQPKAPLTSRQQLTLDRVRERDQPAPTRSERPPPEEAPRLRRPLTGAQQIVMDRMRGGSSQPR